MKKFRVVSWRLCFVWFFGIAVGLAGGQVAVASQESGNGAFIQAPGQEEPPLEEKIELTALYPVLKEKSGRLFEFQVDASLDIISITSQITGIW